MNKVNIVRKHIGNDDFYDINGTPLLTKILDAMDEYAQQQVKNCSIPAVSVVREPVVLGAVCPHFDTCQNGGKNKFCDLQTFKELDCFVGQTER